MMKNHVYIATSLDGDIDWLTQQPGADPGDDFGYSEFIKGVDCIVMGRNSFEKVLSFSEWPYTNTRVLVLSSTLAQIPKGINGLVEGSVELYSGALVSLVGKLENEGCKGLYIDGGQTIQGFLRENLITDITITTVPILLGGGISLFGSVESSIDLQHITTKCYNNGFVQTSYKVKV